MSFPKLIGAPYVFSKKWKYFSVSIHATTMFEKLFCFTCATDVLKILIVAVEVIALKFVVYFNSWLNYLIFVWHEVYLSPVFCQRMKNIHAIAQKLPSLCGFFTLKNYIVYNIIILRCNFFMELLIFNSIFCLLRSLVYPNLQIKSIEWFCFKAEITYD